jgi:hypothetical protein
MKKWIDRLNISGRYDAMEIGDQEMTIGETEIILGFLVLISFACALIEHRISRSDTSNEPRVDPDSLHSKIYPD